jgi:hypothetical protein
MLRGNSIRDKMYLILMDNGSQCMRTLDFWVNIINSNISGQKKLTKRSICFNLKILAEQEKIRLKKATKYNHIMYQIEC